MTDPRAVADDPAARWRAAWTCWPGTGEPLLLMANTAPSAHPYAGHLDAWYCRRSLGLAPAATMRAAIPQLSTLRLYLAGERATLYVAGHAWLQLPGPPPGWSGLLTGRCLIAAYFTAARRPAPASLRRYRTARARGDALIGEVTARCYPGVWRAQALTWP